MIAQKALLLLVAAPVVGNVVEKAAPSRMVELAAEDIKIPIMTLLMSLASLVLVRMVIGSKDGHHKGDWMLTGALAIFLTALVIDYQPRPGIAVGGAMGLGAAGFLVIDILRKRVMQALELASRLAMKVLDVASRMRFGIAPEKAADGPVSTPVAPPAEPESKDVPPSE